MYVPTAAAAVYPSYSKPDQSLWIPGGRHYDASVAEVLTAFTRGSKADERNYRETISDPACPPDYNVGDILENFGYPRDMFDLLTIMYPGI